MDLMTLTPDQIAALSEIAETWPNKPAVIIGATALGFYIDMYWRETSDVDLVVAVDGPELGAIAARPGWKQHPTKEHEFYSPRGARLDILPAASALTGQASITWPSGHVMNLDGIDLAFAHSVSHETDPGLSVLVAPPSVVAILKMVSFLDRPHDRRRDLADIAHLLDLYVDDDSDRRWDEAGDLEFELAPAFLLGLDIGRLAGEPHRPYVTRFLDNIGDRDRPEHSQMEELGPIAWRGQDSPLRKRLAALHRGFQRGNGSEPAGA